MWRFVMEHHETARAGPIALLQAESPPVLMLVEPPPPFEGLSRGAWTIDTTRSPTAGDVLHCDAAIWQDRELWPKPSSSASSEILQTLLRGGPGAEQHRRIRLLGRVRRSVR